MYLVTDEIYLLRSFLGEAIPEEARRIWWSAGVCTEGRKAPAYH